MRSRRRSVDGGRRSGDLRCRLDEARQVIDHGIKLHEQALDGLVEGVGIVGARRALDLIGQIGRAFDAQVTGSRHKIVRLAIECFEVAGFMGC